MSANRATSTLLFVTRTPTAACFESASVENTDAMMLWGSNTLPDRPFTSADAMAPQPTNPIRSESSIAPVNAP
jgi:hypothetical protein